MRKMRQSLLKGTKKTMIFDGVSFLEIFESRMSSFVDETRECLMILRQFQNHPPDEQTIL